MSLGARAIPAEAAAPALYLRGSDRHQDPLDLARGVSGAHQGGRPGSALSVPLGWDGSLPERLIRLRGHSVCLRSPVHVRAWGSVRQSLGLPGLPRWGRVLLDDPPGWRRRGREHCLHRGDDHGPGRRQRQARGVHDCNADKTRGRGGASDDGNRDGDPRLRLSLPVRGGEPGCGGHPTPGQLD